MSEVSSDSHGETRTCSPATAGAAPFVDARLHDFVRIQAKLRPHAPAVTVGGQTVSYEELHLRAEWVADGLCRAGVRRNDFVAVEVDRSVSALAGVLGVLAAGAAYVPIGGDAPDEQIRYIASAASVRVVTGADDRVARATGSVFVAASGQVRPADDRAVGTANPPQADDPAYAIFTSGSTGRPKGVVISHRAAVGSTLTRFNVYPPPTSYLMLAPLTIDAAVAGMYFTWAAGGRLVMPGREDARDAQLLADLVLREEITHLDGLPSQYAVLLRFHPTSLGSLRCVILGGEALPSDLVRRHLLDAGHAQLHNEYGPTEATVWATTHRCSERDAGSLVPIGTAIAGTRVKVLDDKLQPLGVGEVGELYLSGAGLAQGYLGRPALTAERFVADPNPEYPGEQMYRTGDLVAWDEHGELIYHGRSDYLIKVRGFRVELGEVEARLLEHPEVLDVAVVPHTAGPSVRLVAVVVTEQEGAPTAPELRAFAAERLPVYMQPALWRRVDALPTTANGKVDRLYLQDRATAVGTPLQSSTAPHGRPRSANSQEGR